MTIINKYLWHFNELKKCNNSSEQQGKKGVKGGFGPAAPPIRLHLYLSGVVNIIQISTAGTKIYFCNILQMLLLL